MQEGHSDPHFCLPESRKEISVKGTFLGSGDRTPLSPEIGNVGQEASINQLYYFFSFTTPKPKLCLLIQYLLIEHPKYVFVLSSPHKCILCLKSIKAACFGHFLGLISMRPPCTQLKFLFLLLICFVSVLLLVQPRTQDGEGGNFPPPQYYVTR